jgi:hypothetical protein
MANEPVFWEHFSRDAEAWCALMRAGNEEIAFESIAETLDRFGLSYCFDITFDDSLCFLILSPEGDYDAAQVIDQLVAASPHIPGWKVFSRRQRKSLDDARAIVENLYQFDPASARFRVLTRNGTPFIQMFAPPSLELDTEERQGLINTFLWHAIGEDTVMDKHIGGELRLASAPSTAILSAEDIAKRF